MNLLFGALFLLLLPGNAQQTAIDKEFKEHTIQRLNELMIDWYVFPDIAQETADYLLQEWEKGTFEAYTDLESFAEALTEQVRIPSKDKHFSIRPRRQQEAAPATREERIEEQIYQLERQRSTMAGFREVKRLDGNIGYFDLRGFAGLATGVPVADHYMALLADTDAIIVDLRRNGGGSPEMVQYLCSYFFPGGVHLNSLYWRAGDRTEEFWTLAEVGGKKMPEVPLFVLTSPRTFSGAEEFSYNMQTQKRATLVGETTGGGANPGGSHPLNDQLFVFIPSGRAINPITGTNWEGVGVVPDVKTTAEAALDQAIELAKAAAETYREQRRKAYTETLENVFGSLDKLLSMEQRDKVRDALAIAVNANILGEEEVNLLGYDYLRREDGGIRAEVILWSNTQFFPDSPNVYDSYGEVLEANGKLRESLASFTKAVELGAKQADRNLSVYRENRDRLQEKIASDR